MNPSRFTLNKLQLRLRLRPLPLHLRLRLRRPNLFRHHQLPTRRRRLFGRCTAGRGAAERAARARRARSGRSHRSERKGRSKCGEWVEGRAQHRAGEWSRGEREVERGQRACLGLGRCLGLGLYAVRRQLLESFHAALQ